MPGQPFTRSRAFPIFPRRFTLENRQLPPASPLSSFSESESFSRMRWNHCAAQYRAPQPKTICPL
jgi:hypothetical protein